MTDNELIRGIRENSHAAWRELYLSNYGRLKVRIEPMLKLAKGKDFDDVYSEALIALMDNVKDGRLGESDRTNLSGYIYTLCFRIALRLEDKGERETDCRKTMLKEMKSVKSETGEPSTEDDEDDITVSPEEYKEAMDFLDRVLQSIPPACREILRRYYWDNLPMKEIAAIMGLRNENSAKTTKSRCMKKYREIAKMMLADDEAAEAVIRRTVERSVLRDLLEEFRQEETGELARAAYKEKPEDKEKE